ncbi:OLC1v1030172C1 [Oldenlandia corymbosa var. corymbosa]|uniref:gibberellin 3beta-dioxygenase n=1 Tax=Oldenlandia corymbosa var. corymbosa TaxID=529605 RepID=A0AAV1CGG1_OLDCO|nr:OLC1v1030172C1 [Oldenlandia corymbosa var. corymbosa]
MATLSDAYKVIPMTLKHIIPPDFESLKRVPDSHVWPQTDVDLPLQDDDEKPERSIPVIDLMAPNAVELIGHACEDWGAFQLTNHGISTNLIDEVESQARRLFVLPTIEKLKVLRSTDGMTGYGASRMAQSFPKLLWHEGFTIMGSPLHHAQQLWPHDHQVFCDLMENYQKKMKELAHQLLLVMLKWLQVSEEDLKWTFSMAQGSLQLNSYPACPNPKSTIGLAPHTDTMLVTILHQSDPGLQIFNGKSRSWVTVLPVAGALVVNLGNLLQIFSNGKFQSAMHRALVNQYRHRISMAYFYVPPADSMVGPFARFERPVYRTLVLKEYLQIRHEHREDSLSVIRIDDED